MIDRPKIKQAGKTAFHSSYWKCVAAALILGITAGNSSSGSNIGYNEINSNPLTQSENLDMFLSPAFWISMLAVFSVVIIIAVVIEIFVLGPISAGTRRFFLLNRDHGKSTNFGEVLFAFNNSYLNIVKTLFMQNLFIFLWSLLFVIPGIVKSYSYRMVPYILAEKPDLNWHDAISYSKEMMDGHKWECFVYDLSYIGWYLLSGITFGLVGLFYLDPYKACSDAELYTVIRDIHFNKPHTCPGMGPDPTGGDAGMNGGSQSGSQSMWG